MNFSCNSSYLRAKRALPTEPTVSSTQTFWLCLIGARPQIATLGVMFGGTGTSVRCATKLKLQSVDFPYKMASVVAKLLIDLFVRCLSQVQA
jgi:type III secretory pathway component EscS